MPDACVCYRHVSPRECFALRYGCEVQHDGLDEECECSCHDEYHDEGQDFYAEQQREEPPT